MVSTGIAVKGLDELRRALKDASDLGVPKALSEANRSAAELVVQRALPATPSRSGRLRRSVRALGSQRSGRVRAGNAGVPYAGAIHWGRKRGNVGRPPGNHIGANPIAGRPFLTEAAARSQFQIAATYKRAVDRLVVDAIAKRG